MRHEDQIFRGAMSSRTGTSTTIARLETARFSLGQAARLVCLDACSTTCGGSLAAPPRIRSPYDSHVPRRWRSWSTNYRAHVRRHQERYPSVSRVSLPERSGPYLGTVSRWLRGLLA